MSSNLQLIHGNVEFNDLKQMYDLYALKTFIYVIYYYKT